MTTQTTPALATRITDEVLTFLANEREILEDEALTLLDELEALLHAGGKRVRPRFCYWGHVAAGGVDGAEILRIAGSLELLHTFAVIHDDVMDASPMRRNRRTAARALAEASAGRGDAKRFGTSAAILTGLLGFVLADRLFFTSGFTPDVMSRAAERFDGMRTRAIAGQYLDLLAAHRGDADETVARRIALLKTASYTVADPLVIGALCASGDPIVILMLETFGTAIGEAFQHRDDVLGVFGDPRETGKDRDGDLREGKHTLLVAKARRIAGVGEREVLERCVGNPALTAADAERVRDVIVATGALEETNALIDELAASAKQAIDPGVVGADAADALLALADEVTQRRS